MNFAIAHPKANKFGLILLFIIYLKAFEQNRRLI